MPGAYDLELYRGDSYDWRFTLWQDDAQTIPTDLTGVTAKSEIREASAGVRIVALTCTIATPNHVDVKMTPAMYVDCPAIGVWDLQLTYADGRVKTPVAGAVRITPDVTDSLAMAARVVRSQLS